jgi:hypothetical protein
MIQAGFSVCIVVLLAELSTLKSDKGMNKRKMLGIRIHYLVCVPHVVSRRVDSSLGLLHE